MHGSACLFIHAPLYSTACLQPEEEAIAREHIPPPMLLGNYQKAAASCLLRVCVQGVHTWLVCTQGCCGI